MIRESERVDWEELYILESRLGKVVFLIVATLIFFSSLGIIIFSLTMEARLIPSGSMIPTIKVNDQVLVNKTAFWSSPPQRGDIIIFDPPFKAKGYYIKRVIGLPGELVEIKGGMVYINGTLLLEPYIMDPPKYQYGPHKVPTNSLFVLGDNRNASYDSHLWKAWLTIDKVKGKAVYRILPQERMGPIQ
ncbi:MAG: signal peptidase I [Candidatus Saccharibacteria bacterium]